MAEKQVSLWVDEGLWRQGKVRATVHGETIKEWVAGAIKEKLDRERESRGEPGGYIKRVYPPASEEAGK